jgi:hypothetical protein
LTAKTKKRPTKKPKTEIEIEIEIFKEDNSKTISHSQLFQIDPAHQQSEL